jgi:hypothetical protein
MLERQPGEEIGHWHCRSRAIRYRLGGRYPVDAEFIFLNLPQSNDGCVGHFHLGQAHHNTPLAQTRADAIGFCFVLCCAACSRHEEIEAARARQFALATLNREEPTHGSLCSVILPVIRIIRS